MFCWHHPSHQVRLLMTLLSKSLVTCPIYLKSSVGCVCNSCTWTHDFVTLFKLWRWPVRGLKGQTLKHEGQPEGSLNQLESERGPLTKEGWELTWGVWESARGVLEASGKTKTERQTEFLKFLKLCPSSGPLTKEAFFDQKSGFFELPLREIPVCFLQI